MRRYPAPQHLIARISYSRRMTEEEATTVAPVECMCGWQGVTGQWTAHRAENGEKARSNGHSRRGYDSWAWR